jgi:predicted double-glycine peptidase
MLGVMIRNCFHIYLSSLILCSLFFLFSCSTIERRYSTDSSLFLEDVPFYPQEDYQCGPATLAAVMNYWGIPVTPQEIKDNIFSQTAKGTLNIDMLLFAQRKGLHAKQYAGSLDDLKVNIDKGIPLIVLVDYGFSFFQRNHFMVVIGYNNQDIIVNSGKTKGLFITEDEFLRIWEKTDFWALLITK